MIAYRILNTFSRHLITSRPSSSEFFRIRPYLKQCTVNKYRSQSSSATTQGAKNKNRFGSTLKLVLIGTSLGAASGTAYSLFLNWTDKDSHLEHERIPPKVLDQFPDVKITKRFVNPNDMSGMEIVLFQFQTCPFCCKVRAFLDYMGITYSVVEVDAVLRQDIKWSTAKKVPTVLVRQQDGRFVQMSDSSAVISLLVSALNDKRFDIGELAKFYPSVSYFDDHGKKKFDVLNKYFPMYQDNTPKGLTSEMQEHERKWRIWADNHLVHLISPNCYQTLEEALETFRWFSDAGEWEIHFPKWERDLMVYGGATAMWVISKMLKKRHGLSDDVRSHIYDALNKWTNELKKHKTKFMGGKKPNIADLSVFGILSSMEGCQAFKDCLQNTEIGDWFYSVKDLINENRGTLVRERLDGQDKTPANVNVVV